MQELAALSRLYGLVARLIECPHLEAALHEVLTAAIELTGAAMGNVQLLEPQTGTLTIAAQQGFQVDFLHHFGSVDAGETSACGRALRSGGQIVIEDVEADPEYEPHRAVAAAAGYRAVQSTVLVAHDGQLLGVLSTHFPAPHRPTELELRTLELYARQAADFIERVRAQERLRASEERYRTLFESIDEGFCVVEVLFGEAGEAVDYRFLEVNPAFAAQTGLGEAVGRRMRELEPDHEPFWFETYGRIARTGRPERFVHQASRLGGRWYDVFAFRVGEPEARRVAILFNDVSERKRAERELRAAKEAAERASEAKSRFLSTVSHEFRTPLNAVMGLSELMESEVVGPINDTQKDYLRRIRAGAVHLVSLIDEVLTYSRSEAGKEGVTVGEVDVAGIAASVVAMLGHEADVQGLELRLRGADEPVVVLTDGGKVRQILTNLVGNALKYSGTGTVDVELDGGEDVELRVRDTGPGIPADRLEDIFEPFFQVDSSTTREAGGTGLGLTICRRLARLLGGDVTVESTPGEGSTFTLHLPRRPPEAERETAAG